MKKLKVFISSPSDVANERNIANTILSRLKKQYRDYFELEGIFWENDYQTVTGGDFQNQILKPSSTDLVIVILWSRLGTYLDKNKYRGACTGKCVTGTEWEFEDAMNSYRKKKTPDIIVFNKVEDMKVSTNKEKRVRSNKEVDAVLHFIDSWFKTEDGSFKAAFHSFKNDEKFEKRFLDNVEGWIKNHIQKDLDKDISWLQGNPYRGLQSFELEHEDIFFGRKQQIYEVKKAFKKQIESANPFLLVHGASGSGKSSLLKAGVLPYVIQPKFIDGVEEVRYAIFTPNANPNGLLDSFIEALFQKEAFKDELENSNYEFDSLKRVLLTDNIPFEQVFSEIKKPCRLLVIIDQLEEIFTNKSFNVAQKKEFLTLLSRLMKHNYIWVLSTIRTDFLIELESVEILKEIAQNAYYALGLPSVSQIEELICEPAKAASLQFEKKENIGLDEVLRDSTKNNESALPLLEYVLSELYKKHDDRVLTYKAYFEIGKLEGAISKKAERVYATFSLEEQKALESLIRMMVSVSSDDLKKTSKSIDIDKSNFDKVKKDVIEKMTSSDVRLFIQHGKRVKVIHEALFTNWDRAKKNVNNAIKDIQLRDRLENDYLLWKSSKEKKYFIPHGERLDEALRLKKDHRFELDDKLVNYIEKSFKYRRVRRKFSTGSIVILGLISIFIGGIAYTKHKSYEKSHSELQEKKSLIKNDYVQHAYSAIANKELSKAHLYAWKSLKSLTKTKTNTKVYKTMEDIVLQELFSELLSSRDILENKKNKLINIEFFKNTNDFIYSDNDSFSEIKSFKNLHRNVHNLLLSEDELYVVASTNNIYVWSVNSGEIIKKFPHKGEVAFSHDSNYLAYSFFDREHKNTSVGFWNIKDDMTTTFFIGDFKVIALKFISNEKMAFVSKNSIQIWDINKRKQLHSLKGHEDTINDISISADGKYIVSVSEDKTIKIWDVEKAKLLRTLIGHSSGVRQAIISNNGEYIVSTSDDKTLRIWDFEKGFHIETLLAHKGLVIDIKFFKDDKRLMSTSEDGIVKVWNMERKHIDVNLSSIEVNERIQFFEEQLK